MGLRGHKVTQITEYKPLDDEDSEYDVRSYPKKPQPHCLFFMWTWGNVIQGKLNFFPTFYPTLLVFNFSFKKCS